MLKDRSIVVVDDSIVRGSTMRKLVRMLYAAGAAQVHLRIGAPPVTHSCYYGIDTPNRSELIAATHSTAEIESYLGVDSLRYLSVEGLRSCVDDPDNYCTACFSGEYPTVRNGVHPKDIFEHGCGCGGCEES